MRLAWGLVYGGVAVAAVLGARILADVLHYAVPCPFHAATGVPCPTCYGLRALAALGRGEVGRAIALHPLFAVSALLLAGGGLLSGALLLSGRRTLPWGLGASGTRAIRWAIPLALLANWFLLVLRG